MYDGKEDDDILSYSFCDSHTHRRHARTRAHTGKLAWILRIDPNCLRRKLPCPACGKECVCISSLKWNKLNVDSLLSLDTERADRIRVHMLSQHPDVLEKHWPHPLKDPETLVQELCEPQKPRANTPINHPPPIPTSSVPVLSRSSSTMSVTPSESYSAAELTYPYVDSSSSYTNGTPQWSLYANANPPYRESTTPDPMLWDKDQASALTSMDAGGSSDTLQQDQGVLSGGSVPSSQTPYAVSGYWGEPYGEDQQYAHTNFFPSYAANHNTHWQTEMPFTLGPQAQHASAAQSACGFSFL